MQKTLTKRFFYATIEKNAEHSACERNKTMNIDYEAALQYIDLGNYEKAEESLNKAIKAELDKNDPSSAAKYRCVLGELFANLGRPDDARGQFEQVLEFCGTTHTLEPQRLISQRYIDAFDGKIPAPAPAKRNPSVPLIPKPVQDKGFISGKMKRR